MFEIMAAKIVKTCKSCGTGDFTASECCMFFTECMSIEMLQHIEDQVALLTLEELGRYCTSVLCQIADQSRGVVHVSLVAFLSGRSLG
jgi:hypothetical protein